MLAGLAGLALLAPGSASSQEGVDEILQELQGLLGLGGADADPKALVDAALPAVEQAAGMRAKGPIQVRIASREQAREHSDRGECRGSPALIFDDIALICI